MRSAIPAEVYDYRFTLLGNLRPKKNAHVIAKRRNGKMFIRNAQANVDSWAGLIHLTRSAWAFAPITEDVVIRAVFYRDNARRVDTSNLVSAFSDILEKAGVVADDRFAHVWPSPVQVDEGNPRVVWWIVKPDLEVDR